MLGEEIGMVPLSEPTSREKEIDNKSNAPILKTVQGHRSSTTKKNAKVSFPIHFPPDGSK